MKRLLLSTALLSLAMPAIAQDATDKVPLTVTRQSLQIIGKGLMELPYKEAAGVMNDLQLQLNAHDAAAVEAAKAKAAEAAKGPEPKPDAKPAPTPPAK